MQNKKKEVMMMKKRNKKKRSKFRDKVIDNAHKQHIQGAQYGYLSLPRGISIFKEEPSSRVKLDILPYRVTDANHPDRDDYMEVALPGELWYKRPYKVHRNVGVDNDSVICPTSISKRCPICEYRLKRIEEGADLDETRPLKASLRNLYVVVPKGHKDYEEEPHIWDISQYLFQNQLNEELEEDEDLGVFPDLEEGLTLRIRFSKGQIGKNVFAEVSRIDFEERKESYDEDILERVPNLDEILTILSYKQLQTKFFEMEDEPITEDEEKIEEEGIDEIAEPDIEQEEEPDVEQEEKEEKEKKNSRRKKKEDKNKCPHGFVFGDDCEEYDECDECEEWEDCIDAKEESS